MTGFEIAKQLTVDLKEIFRRLTDLEASPTDTSAGVPAHASTHENAGADEVNVLGLSGELADAQPVAVSKDSGAIVGTRSELNFIEGANITLTIADDAIGDEVDITIASAGGITAHTILDGVVHTDSAVDAVTQGSLIVGNSTPLWDELLEPGVAGCALVSDGTTFAWSQTPTWTGDHTWTSSIATKPTLTIENTNADATAPVIDFYKNSASPADNDNLGIVLFRGETSTGVSNTYAYIVGESSDVTNISTAAAIKFYVEMQSNHRNLLELQGYNGSLDEGEVVINQDGQDVDTRIEAVGVPNAFTVQGSDGEIGVASDFTFTANSFNVLAGSDITIANGESIGIGPALERIEFYTAGNIAMMGANVGIGVAAPGEKLVVAGGTTLTFDVDSFANVAIIHSTDATSSLDVNNTAAGGDTRLYATEDIHFRTSSVDPAVTILKNGNVGIGTTAPGQIFDVNSGSGNMIADGYDTHSLAQYKEEIEVAGGGFADKIKAFNLHRWRRVPFVSTVELVSLAMAHFEIDAGEIDARKYYQNLPNDGKIRQWIDAKRVELRQERRGLAKYQRQHIGLVADDADTVAAIPQVISRDDDGNITGYSMTNHVGFLHGVIRELVDRIEALEA